MVSDLREKIEQIKQGGGEASRQKHEARGKLLPRERVRALLDVGSPFLELSQLAGWNMPSSTTTRSWIARWPLLLSS